jgi:hypothetical protein
MGQAEGFSPGLEAGCTLDQTVEHLLDLEVECTPDQGEDFILDREVVYFQALAGAFSLVLVGGFLLGQAGASLLGREVVFSMVLAAGCIMDHVPILIIAIFHRGLCL